MRRSRRRTTCPPRSPSPVSAAPARRPTPVCVPPSTASTRARRAGSSRRASPSARSSAPSRRSCCPPSRRSPTTAPAPSTGSPGAGPRAGSRRPYDLSPAATREEGVVIFDASTACDIESLYVQALELTLRRRGMRTLTISVALDPARMARALHAVEPDERRRPRRSRRRPRRARPPRLRRAPHRRRRLTICDFRHALPDSGASTVTRLGDKPIAAVDHLIAAIDGREVWPAAPTGMESVERLAG